MVSNDYIERIIWRESGLFGISGYCGDMRELLKASDASSNLAVEIFVIRVAQGIAAMATGLGGVDAVVFTGEIGTQSPVIRQPVVEHFSWVGIRVRSDSNDTGATPVDANDSSSKISLVEVDEVH